MGRAELLHFVIAYVSLRRHKPTTRITSYRMKIIATRKQIKTLTLNLGTFLVMEQW